MPSSTSSFDRPFRVLGLAVLAAALLAAAWSAFWWGRGFTPSPLDDVNLWGIWRHRADGNPRVLALAGSSRLLMGLDLATLRARFPDRQIIQLSVNGGSPLAVLQNLADDPSFQGSVICEILPHQAYTDLSWGQAWDGYENQPLSQRLEAPIHLYLAQKTNLLLPDLGLLNVLRELGKYHRLIRPSYFHFDADRQGRLDFAQLTPAELTLLREDNRHSYTIKGTPLAPAAFDARIAEIHHYAEKIRRRGGRVLFFRMVSSPPVSDIQAARFPDPVYWNVFRQQVGFPCLNYADFPSLAAFTCPEGVHLDQSEEPVFTAAFADAITSQNLLR